MTEDKRKELDNFLQQTQESLHRLGEYFEKNPRAVSYQNLKDIMTLYRKCQEWEKIVKTSFFEEPELKDLIEQLKEFLHEERRNEMNQQILRVHRSRQSVGSVAEGGVVKDSMNRLLEECQNTKVEQGDIKAADGNMNGSGDKITSAACETPKQGGDTGVDVEKLESHEMAGNEKKGSEGDSKSQGATADSKEKITVGDGNKKDEIVNDRVVQKAELCYKICLKFHGAMTKILQEVDHRWKTTQSKASEALVKSGGVTLALNESLHEVCNALSAKNILLKLATDEKGCEVLEEVMMGMDLDRSKSSSPTQLAVEENIYKDIVTSDIEGLYTFFVNYVQYIAMIGALHLLAISKIHVISSEHSEKFYLGHC